MLLMMFERCTNRNYFPYKDLRNHFEAIEPELIRFPSLDADALRGKIEIFIADLEHNPEEEKS
jgi:hypothetical protein